MFRFENGCGGFLLNIHHIISDGWTLGLVCRKIMKAYSNIKNNQEISEDLEFSYIDYAQKESEYVKSEKFLKDKIISKKFSKVITLTLLSHYANIVLKL